MKKLFKIFTIVFVIATAGTSCSSNDDFADIIISSDLEVESTQGSGDREVAKPGDDD